MDAESILTAKLLGKEVADKHQKTIEAVGYYAKVASLIERTYLAMGRKAAFKVSTSATANEKLNKDVYATTH